MRRRTGWLVAVATVVVCVDQLTKWWALQALDDGPVHLAWTLRLRLAFNTGAAFSLGSGRGGLIALLAVAVVLAMVAASRSVTDRRGAIALGVVLGGALGNLVDRLLRSGTGGADVGLLGGPVVDFIDLQWWPVFNMADVAIVVGAALLVVASSRESHPTRRRRRGDLVGERSEPRQGVERSELALSEPTKQGRRWRRHDLRRAKRAWQ